MVKFKEQVAQCQDKIAQYKDKLSMVEKEKVELEGIKSSVTFVQQRPTQDDNSSEALVKAMAALKLKDVETENLKDNLVLKDTHITSLKKIVTQRKYDTKEAQSSKNQMKERLSKYDNKLVGKSILKDARHTLWDQLALEVTKFRTYLEFVQEEFEIYNVSNKKCDVVAQELTQRPIEVAQKIIEYMNSTSKSDLQVLKVENISTMIMMENKVIYKHRYVQSVRKKAQTLHKKIQHFRNKFSNIFNKGMPSLWDKEGNLTFQQDYQALLVQNKSEEEKFEDMEKKIKRSNHCGKSH